MVKYFNFYDPLEKRYLFNSFLVVVALVEVLILVFTLIWQIDEGIFSDQVRVVPFPWREYLLVSFAAPIALLFLFGMIVRGFQALTPESPGPEAGLPPRRSRLLSTRVRFFLGLLALLTLLVLLLYGDKLLSSLTRMCKGLGLGGTYVVVGLVAGACLYIPLRLLLKYRLQKRALDYQFLQYLAERHGLVAFDPHNPKQISPEAIKALTRPEVSSPPESLSPPSKNPS